MKFHGQPELCLALAALMRQAWQRAIDSGLPAGVDWIVPVPASDQRLRERGFNQAWELARRLAAPLRTRARPDLLHRVVDQPHQAALGRAERLANLRSAFVAPPQADLRGSRVLLVDDVMTTGSTAREAAAALLRGGVAGVALLVLARTEAPRPAQPSG
jgi:ComF family protein